MENFNFSMANQMLTILKSLNDNIVSLSERACCGKDDKDNDDDKMEEGSIMDLFSHMDQSHEKDNEHLEEKLQ